MKQMNIDRIILYLHSNLCIVTIIESKYAFIMYICIGLLLKCVHIISIKMLTQQDNAMALLGNKTSINNNTPVSNSKLSQKVDTGPQHGSVITQQNAKHTVTQEQKKQKKDNTQFTSVLKIFNIMIGIVVIVFGIICYTFFADDTRKLNYVGYILPGYISVSGFLILLIQLNIGFIIRNMKFLYNYFGRGLFNIYVGIMPLSLIKDDPDDPQDQVFQIAIIIMVSLMCLIGVLYIFAKIFCCAKQSKNRKKRKYSSDQSD